MTITELQRAVDEDEKNHSIKKLAELLLEAMNDWPTPNQTRIEEFIEEAKLYYGYPITTEKINNKKLDLTKSHDSWKQESGTTIIKMIETSKEIEEESTFEKVIKDILAYYHKT